MTSTWSCMSCGMKQDWHLESTLQVLYPRNGISEISCCDVPLLAETWREASSCEGDSSKTELMMRSENCFQAICSWNMQAMAVVDAFVEASICQNVDRVLQEGQLWWMIFRHVLKHIYFLITMVGIGTGYSDDMRKNYAEVVGDAIFTCLWTYQYILSGHSLDWKKESQASYVICLMCFTTILFLLSENINI